jgi:hypothetical protein
VRLTFTIDGGLNVSGSDETRMEVDYQQDAGPLFTLLAAGYSPVNQETFMSAPNSFGTRFGPGTFGGFTLAAQSLNGSGEFTTSDLPIVFGTSFDVTAGLLVWAIPSATDTAFIDFLSTVRLTGIQVLNASQQPVAFTIVSGSGTSYDASGVHLTPDPFTVLTRSGTPLPGGTGYLTGIPQGPPVSTTRAAFLGLGTSGQEGIYAGAVLAPSPPPIKVADLATAIPGGTGTFTGFGSPSLTTSPVANPDPPPIRLGFLGSGAGQQGVYLSDVTDVSAPLPPPIKVADLATAIPGGAGAFTGFGDLSLTTSPVASPQPPPIRLGFLGSGAGQQGIYLSSIADVTAPSPPPIKVADLATPIPDGTGTFTGFGGISLTSSPVALPNPPPIRVGFLGSGVGQEGIYLSSIADVTQPGSPPIKIADLATAIPGGAGTFSGFTGLSLTVSPIAVPQGPPIRVAFIGSGDGQQGVYLSDVTDVTNPLPPPIKVADLATAVPGGVGTFTAFDAVSASLEHTAFLGEGSNGQAGIYVASTPSKVIAVGDTLEGKTVTALRLGREGLDGDRLTFAATFADGSQGLFAFAVPASPGTGPGSIGDSLRIAPSTSTPGDVTLTWSASCSANALNYAVYEGAIGHWYSHAARDCVDGVNLTEELTPSAGNRYYLVVPLGVSGEGTYGRDSKGMERPVGAGGRCMAAQVIETCP